MSADPVVAGVGMTAFGRQPERSLRALAAEATAEALADAGAPAEDVGLVVAGNCVAGLIGGQEMIRGQVELVGTPLAGTPVLNVENACATSSSAVHVARMAVASGEHEVVLALGAEKMNAGDKRASIRAIASAADVERLDELQRELTGRDGPAESFFMEVYASMARAYMARTGATAEQFAQVTVKNRRHGAHNPKAQYGGEVSAEEVLASRPIADPLTLLMCSPVADGAAAVLVCSAAYARRSGADAVRLRATALGSGRPEAGAEALVTRVADRAYAAAGVGPGDVDVVEVHDAASPGELMAYEELRLCADGEGPALLATGATALGGRVPVNPSGGLVCKGHPIGATGAAQIVELVTQLRGRAGGRQVDGARVALAENAGGYLHPEPAACVVTVLSRD